MITSLPCPRVAQSRQHGWSLIGVLVVGTVLAFALLMVARAVPVLTEYMALQRIVTALAEEGRSGASVAEMRRGFERRAQVDSIMSVRSSDVLIHRESDGVNVEVAYERIIPIAGNASLLLEFHVKAER